MNKCVSVNFCSSFHQVLMFIFFFFIWCKYILVNLEKKIVVFSIIYIYINVCTNIMYWAKITFRSIFQSNCVCVFFSRSTRQQMTWFFIDDVKKKMKTGRKMYINPKQVHFYFFCNSIRSEPIDLIFKPQQTYFIVINYSLHDFFQLKTNKTICLTTASYNEFV